MTLPSEPTNRIEGNSQATAAPPPQRAEAKVAGKDAKVHEHKDSLRESLETVVFVVFLVLLLKAFVAEAFVIPTGSMAITLYGEHCQVTCERCGYPYVVNAQHQNETLRTTDVICPNCRHKIENMPVISSGGDKVLVFKARYDYADPDRHDVIVFKFPGEPLYLNGPAIDERRGGAQKDYTAHNYVKRLWGVPGDRLAIWYGDVHVRLGTGAQERLQIIRRSPDKYLSMRRIVSDFDYQDKSLPLPPRWSDEGADPAWQAADDGKAFQLAGGGRNWLTFRNYLRPEGTSPQDLERARRPQLITDVMEYNPVSSWHWTPDLMIECDVHVNESTGEFILELSGGVDRHQAVFNLESGSCTLQTAREGRLLSFVDADGKELPAERAKADTKLHKTGKHTVRFCSFDQRLTLWVDNKLIFDDGLVLPLLKDEERGPRLADFRPVRIGAGGAKLKVAKLRVYRDIYYTRDTSSDMSMDRSGQLSLPLEVERQLMDALVQRLTPQERLLPPDQQRDLIEHRTPLIESIALSPQDLHLSPEALRKLIRERSEFDSSKRDRWSVYYPRKVGGDMPDQKNYPIVHPEFHPEDRLGPDEFFALGDNSTQSSDSRAWGQVPRRLLLGKAVSVYWPIPSRFGLIR